MDRLLCPIKALKFYLKMTSSYRQNRTRLFLPIKGNQGVSKVSVSRWTINFAYRKLTRRDISFLKIKAHEVRALSSSWASFDKVRLSEILKAAVWNQSSTSLIFLPEEYVSTSSYLHTLGPIVVAQKVVLFVCVEVLRPSQPNGVISSAVSLPNHTFTGQA